MHSGCFVRCDLQPSLGFDIEAQTKAAIKELAPALSKVSAERIQVELVKLLTSDNPQMMRSV